MYGGLEIIVRVWEWDGVAFGFLKMSVYKKKSVPNQLRSVAPETYPTPRCPMCKQTLPSITMYILSPRSPCLKITWNSLNASICHDEERESEDGKEWRGVGRPRVGAPLRCERPAVARVMREA